MSIVFSGGRKKIVCDECDSDMTGLYSPSSFSDMIEEAKNNGVIEQTDPGEWSHTCSDCCVTRPSGLRAARDLFGL